MMSDGLMTPRPRLRLAGLPLGPPPGVSQQSRVSPLDQLCTTRSIFSAVQPMLYRFCRPRDWREVGVNTKCRRLITIHHVPS